MPNRVVVFTISDRCFRGEAEDRSGPAILELLPILDGTLVHRQILPDEIDRIRAGAESWLRRCELILCTGGTGVAERDVTPEAIAPLIERPLPGFGEIMRLNAFSRVPTAIVSRGGAAIAAGTLLVWLPGSPTAAVECVEWLAPAIRHVCAFLRGDGPH